MPSKNKVKFNLKNVHVAPIIAESETTLTYGEVKHIPGAVSASLEAQGDIEPFYADGIVYYQSAANNGYSGDMELALIPDWFREEILGEVRNGDGVLTENANAQPKDFALGFQVDGDQRETLFWFLRVSATRPTTEASTNEASKSPQTDTLSISCAPAPDGSIRAKTSDDTPDEIKEHWFDKVYQADDTAMTGAKAVSLPESETSLDNEKTVGSYIEKNDKAKITFLAWLGVASGKLLQVDGSYYYPLKVSDARLKVVGQNCVAKATTAEPTIWLVNLGADTKSLKTCKADVLDDTKTVATVTFTGVTT